MSKTENENLNMEEIETLEKNKIFDYVRFVYPNIHGISKGGSIPRRHLEKSIETGLSWYMGIIQIGARSGLNLVREIEENNFANCLFKPMTGTFRQISNKTQNNRKIGQVICESFQQDTNGQIKHIDGCSRYVARKQIKRLEQLGLVIKTAFEVEFIVYESNSLKPVFLGTDVGSVLRLANFENYLYDIEESLTKSSVDINYLEIEYAEGQFELSTEPQDGILAVDSMFLVKQIIKEISQKENWTATFMSMPFESSGTIGLHLNHSLWEGPVNKFSDRSSPDGISDLMKHWVAGLVEHGAALTAICCPTVNCYRRLHSKATPDRIDWDFDNRFSTFRLKNTSTSATFVESRLPSGACNPYLALAATIAAGLDGIERKLELKPIKSNEVVVSGKNGGLGIGGGSGKLLPVCLEEALQELEKDRIIVEALGEQIVRWFCQCKRTTEIEPIEKLDTDRDKFEKERELYFEFI